MPSPSSPTSSILPAPPVHPGSAGRWLLRVGPVLIAFLLGAFLVMSSSLSYRDARLSARLLAERQGIALLFRLQHMFREKARDPGALAAALEAHRSMGLTYVGVVQGGEIVASVGEPLLPGAEPELGAPAFGEGRVRMVSPGAGRRKAVATVPEAARTAEVPGPVNAAPGKNQAELFPLPPFMDRPLSFPRHEFQVVVEFKPRGDAGVIRRSMLVLSLSWGMAVLLTVAAVVLSVLARRAQAVSQRMTAQSHLAQLGEMSAVLAHEIRNPLAALKGHAQLLAERLVDQPLKSRVERVVTEAGRLESLTNSLLRFASAGTIQLSAVDPREIVNRAIAATDPTRVEAKSSTAPRQWTLDQARMEQVLVNLIDNALAVTPPRAKVVAEVTAEGDQLIYLVRDHGPGVPPAERSRIFDAFHTTKVHGTGLGLSMSKRIVDLHGGTISVDDAPGGGAAFRVRLPRRGPGEVEAVT